MRITHSKKASFIQGTVEEEAQIRAWIERAQQKDKNLTIMVDECDEDESSFTIVSRHSTQKERHELFQSVKHA